MEQSCAQLLMEARQRAGLSRSALANKAGVPTSTVSRIEDAEIDPRISTIEHLIHATGSRLIFQTIPGDDGPTLASLTNALDTAGGREKIDWTRLRGFADWADRHPGALSQAIADAPIRVDGPFDAILASFAEQLASDHDLPRPRWTRAIGPLPERWSPPGTPRMLAHAESTTPEPFRRRNIVLSRSAIFRTGP